MRAVVARDGQVSDNPKHGLPLGTDRYPAAKTDFAFTLLSTWALSCIAASECATSYRLLTRRMFTAPQACRYNRLGARAPRQIRRAPATSLPVT